MNIGLGSFQRKYKHVINSHHSTKC